MARLLEEGGERVVFVAMLDASSLFASPTLASAIRQAVNFLRGKCAPPREFMAEALRKYRPRPWFGKILHLRPNSSACLDWRRIAPQGVASYDAPAEMLAEPNVQIVATILAAELLQSKRP
jgi:hypothetical protein